MAKNETMNITEGKTLEQLKQELSDAIDAHNEASTAADRVAAAVKVEKLKKSYDATSLLNTYAECLEDDLPILTFIKTYTYKVSATQRDKDTGDYKLKSDGDRVMNLWNFVEFCEGRNRLVTVDLTWKSKAKDAQEELIRQAKAFIEDGSDFTVGSFKRTVQAMFDAIVMVAGENGNNAVIAKSKNMRTILLASGKMNLKTLEANFGAGKAWQGNVLAMLNCAVSNKDFTITYGDPDDEVEEETEEETATESEAPVTTEEAPATEQASK